MTVKCSERDFRTVEAATEVPRHLRGEWWGFDDDDFQSMSSRTASSSRGARNASVGEPSDAGAGRPFPPPAGGRPDISASPLSVAGRARSLARTWRSRQPSPNWNVGHPLTKPDCLDDCAADAVEHVERVFDLVLEDRAKLEALP